MSRAPLLCFLSAALVFAACDDDSNSDQPADSGQQGDTADTSPDEGQPDAGDPDAGDPDAAPDAAEADTEPDLAEGDSGDASGDAGESPVPAAEYEIILAALEVPGVLDIDPFQFDNWVIDSQTFIGTDAYERITDLEPGSTLEDQVVFMLEESETWAAFDNEEILADYTDENAAPHDLDGAAFGLTQNIAEYDRAEFRELFVNGPFEGWDAFNAMFPNTPGYLSFSRVGLNEAGDEALVHVELLCGPLCGAGAYVMLRREGDEWVWEAWIQDLFI